jgi:hypothetical protein
MYLAEVQILDELRNVGCMLCNREIRTGTIPPFWIKVPQADIDNAQF